MNTIFLNTDNLTSLWKTASIPFNTYFNNNDIHHCFIPNSQWPNRIWANDEVSEIMLSQIVKLSNNNPSELTFSYFYKNENDKNTSNIIKAGFMTKFNQYGMSLIPKDIYNTKTQLTFRLVQTEVDIKIWRTTFQQAFGYCISEETLLKSYQKIKYYIVYYNENCIGTVVLHQTNSTMGVHSLGIVPNRRGKGFATEIMHFVLNFSKKSNSKLVTLQASEMAKNMYLKFGFSIDFFIKNFIQNKESNSTII